MPNRFEVSVPGLTAEQDTQLQITRYVYVATVTAFVYDFLLSLHEEVALMQYKVNIATLVYWISKLTAGGFITTTMVLLVYPVGTSSQCQAVQEALGWCYVVAAPSAALLFYFRITAIFAFHRPVVLFFSFLWLGVVAGAFTVPFSVTVAQIGETRRCVDVDVASYSSSTVIINWINDTLIFSAITWKLLSSSMVEQTWKGRMRSFVSGAGFSELTRAVLQGGQMYYLVTVGFNIVTIIGLLAPIPATFHALFTVPNLALQNAMACRVYRQLKLGIIRQRTEDQVATTQFEETHLSFARTRTWWGRGRGPAGRRREELSFPLTTFGEGDVRSVKIQVTRTQEEDVS